MEKNGLVRSLAPSSVFLSHDNRDCRLAEDFDETLRKLSRNRVVGFAATAKQPGRGISPGAEWRKVVRREIQQSVALVAFLTKRGVSRPWVNYELGVADECGKEIFALVFDSDTKELVNHPLSDRQWTKPTPAHLTRLFSRVLQAGSIRVPNATMVEREARAFLRRCDGFLAVEEEFDTLEHYHLACVTTQLQDAARVAHYELDHTVRRTEDHYLETMIAEVRRLGPADKLLAICGDKDWGLDSVYTYFNENVLAAQRGTAVHRIYIEPAHGTYPDGFHAAEWSVIESHLAWQRVLPSFRVSVLLGRQAAEARAKFHLPSGFGMVVPTGPAPFAMIHFGLNESDRRGRLFRSGLLAQIYRSIHRDISHMASPAREVEQRLQTVATQRHPDLEYPPGKISRGFTNRRDLER